MKILVVNDDGIESRGIEILAKWAATLGEVWVVAPREQQSAKSHAILVHSPISVEQRTLGWGEKVAYAVASTPVDCVRFAHLGLHEKFDLILSGINKGYNLGEDILYSGTLGALFEAGLQKTKGLAFSTDFDSFETAKLYLDEVWKFVQEKRLFDRHLIYNVNIPPVTPKGILFTRQGGVYYADNFVDCGNGVWEQRGFCAHQNHHDYTVDTDAVVDGYVSITPMSVDRTHIGVLKDLTNL